MILYNKYDLSVTSSQHSPHLSISNVAEGGQLKLKKVITLYIIILFSTQKGYNFIYNNIFLSYENGNQILHFLKETPRA